MGNNKQFYLIIGVLVIIVFLQFIFKPKAADTKFEASIEKFNQSLNHFAAMNADLKARAESLDTFRSNLEQQYEGQRALLQLQVVNISNSISSLDRKYGQMNTEVSALKGLWSKSKGPDSLATLSSLRSHK